MRVGAEVGRPRVAFVRGDALNPFETQVFSHLRGYDVRAVGRAPASYEVDLVPIPVSLLPGAAGDNRAVRVGGRFGVPVRRWFGSPGRLRGLQEALRSADIIHAAETFIPLSEQCADIAADTGAELVLTCWENIPFLHDEDPTMVARKRKLRDAASLFVAVTPTARDALIAEGVAAERITVVPAAVDVERFRSEHDPVFLTERFPQLRGAKTVLFVGRMIREKGVTELVHAFSRMRLASGPPPHLVCVGNGPEATRVRTAADVLGITDRVHVLEGQSYRDIPSIFRAADVVVIPSLSTPYWQEQFGFVLAEAMACGRPVISTRTGSIPDVVGDAALLVDDYDVGALAAALERLLTDEDLAAALGSRARARAERVFAAEIVAPQLADVYATALAR